MSISNSKRDYNSLSIMPAITYRKTSNPRKSILQTVQFCSCYRISVQFPAKYIKCIRLLIFNTAHTTVDGMEIKKDKLPVDQEQVFASQHNDKHQMQQPKPLFPVTPTIKVNKILGKYSNLPELKYIQLAKEGN